MQRVSRLSLRVAQLPLNTLQPITSQCILKGTLANGTNPDQTKHNFASSDKGFSRFWKVKKF